MSQDRFLVRRWKRGLVRAEGAVLVQYVRLMNSRVVKAERKDEKKEKILPDSTSLGGYVSTC